jgi:diguanylate cyclase (GGDEF)-like protein/PAS domain S-box-containing protein
MIDTANFSAYITLLRSTLNSASDAFIIVDSENNIIEWSARAERFFGWTAQEAVGGSISELIIPKENRPRQEQALKRYLKTRKENILGQRLRINALHKDGREMPVELTVNAIEVEQQIFFSVAIRDKLHQSVYENSLEQQAALLNLSRDSIVVCDLDYKLLFWNDGARRLYGYTREEAVRRVKHELLKSIYPKPLQEIRQELLSTRHWEGEVFQQGKDGRPIAVLSRWALDVDAYGAPTRILISNTDISDSKQYQHHIRFLATHDMLTGLPNRTLLEDRLQHAIEKARRQNESMAILSVALNRFKAVNGSLGHDAGNLLLREIAKRLVHAVGEDNTVARLGGAEFVVCVEKLNAAENAREIAEHVLKTISRPARVTEHEIFLSASMGVSIYPKDGADHTALLHAANMAMHQAKQHSAGAFHFYSPEMNARVIQRSRTENALHGAVGREEFMLHYQPRIGAHSKRLVALEALIRWQDPEKGTIYPAEFIPLAEEIGLIGEIGEWVLRTACRQNIQWQKMGFPPVRVSVNVSPKQLGSSFLQQTVAKVLADTQLDACWLELEVTETGLMENIESAQQTLTEIRKLGVLISIDDFGTGYSSLAHLKKLPIDALKIDRSFISDLGKDPDDVAIVTATIAMARSMDLKVVAEGVETQEQVDFLTNLKCEELQGFYFSKALPASELEQALRLGQWLNRGPDKPDLDPGAPLTGDRE